MFKGTKNSSWGIQYGWEQGHQLRLCNELTIMMGWFHHRFLCQKCLNQK